MTSVLIECAHDTENNEGEQCKQRSQAVGVRGGGEGGGERIGGACLHIEVSRGRANHLETE